MTRVRLAFHCLTLALAAAAGWALNMHTTTQQLASRQPGRQQKGAAVRARAAVRNVLVMAAVLQRFFRGRCMLFFKTGVTFFFWIKAFGLGGCHGLGLLGAIMAANPTLHTIIMQ